MPELVASTDWLTIPEVADRLRVSRMTTYRLVHAGTLPAHRIGRGFRIHPDDLAAYLAAVRTTNTETGS